LLPAFWLRRGVGGSKVGGGGKVVRRRGGGRGKKQKKTQKGNNIVPAGTPGKTDSKGKIIGGKNVLCLRKGERPWRARGKKKRKLRSSAGIGGFRSKAGKGGGDWPPL